MHSQKDSHKDIAYEFSMGTDVDRTLRVTDMTGKVRRFRIHINDEKGITSCQILEDQH